ncbi:MAG TPA: hypothetical protein VMU06_24360, partial [Stellaceae bacterium]|nr:hypothetical protein [Stellaceae bacterium]
AETLFRRGIAARDLGQIGAATGLAPAPSEISKESAEAVAKALRAASGASHALAVLVDLDQGADRIDFGATICIGIATERETAVRRSRIVGGRDWVRLGAMELGLDCLRRFLLGLPVTERIDFEKV